MLTLGLPQNIADLIGVTVFRMVEIRPGGAPSILRGPWCPCARSSRCEYHWMNLTLFILDPFTPYRPRFGVL